MTCFFVVVVVVVGVGVVVVVVVVVVGFLIVSQFFVCCFAHIF